MFMCSIGSFVIPFDFTLQVFDKYEKNPVSFKMKIKLIVNDIESKASSINAIDDIDMLTLFVVEK